MSVPTVVFARRSCPYEQGQSSWKPEMLQSGRNWYRSPGNLKSISRGFPRSEKAASISRFWLRSSPRKAGRSSHPGRSGRSRVPGRTPGKSC